MYGMVLMMTLGSGGDVLAWQDQTRPAIQIEHAHQLNRHRRGGGCYGGGCYGGGCWGGGCYGSCWGGSPYGGTMYGAPGPAQMPPPSKRSSYYGPGEMPMPGAGEYRRDERTPPPPDRDRRTNPPNNDQTQGPPDEARSLAPATIIVTLPADASLTIDDTPTRSTTERRVFVSPPLQPGKTFHYTLKAQAMRDGKPVTTTQRIDVRAGQVTRVELNLPERVARR